MTIIRQTIYWCINIMADTVYAQHETFPYGDTASTTVPHTNFGAMIKTEVVNPDK